MRCSACGHENRPQARYCDQCGAPLAVAPPAGGGAGPPASYTPRHLAERILTTRAALQGERKPVTVLFADVTGSLALAEQVDAEEWHAMMNRFFAILSDGVHRFEGTVNQYTGDGIMALFGAPLAHEDHAQRACHAALHLTQALRAHAQELRRERGLQFSVRMGLNSGEVVVGSIGDDLRMDYTAQGHTVGLASRMEQLCEPGRVYLTEHTAALVEGFFELEDLGAFTIKGVRAPVRVFALLGPGPLRTRLDAARAHGLSRLVGRAAELGALERALDDAAAGRATVVAIAADAGVGKSRLCAEFCERCAARGVAVATSYALAHGAALPYLPILELFRQLLGIGERDPAEVARQKIAGAVLLLDDAFKDRLALLFDFLGVPDPARRGGAAEPDARLSVLVDTCVALLRARAARQPAIVLLEDLHWFDAASDAFLRRLLPALEGLRVLLVLNFRPEYADDWLAAFDCRPLPLRPLDSAAGEELTAALLGSDASLGDLPSRLCARAAGNPFFTEELVRSLAQSGALVGTPGAYRLARPVDDAAIPATVHAVLAARIDRLAPRDKEVLQTAAVIGKQFTAPVLRAVAACSDAELAAALGELGRAELIVTIVAGRGVEYAFQHPLTQEVAYATQLGARRAQMHAAVARTLETLRDETHAESAALIAFHWEHAGAGWEAAQWLRRAARALVGTDSGEGLRCLCRVLALLRSVPERPETTALALETAEDALRVGSIVGMALDKAEPIFREAIALAERTGNRSLQARLLSTYAEFQMMSGRPAGAGVHLQQATTLARHLDDADVQLNVALDNAQTGFWGGRLRETLSHVETSLALLRSGTLGHETIAVGMSGESFALALRGLCLSLMGRPVEGAADLERALAIAETTAPLEGRCIGQQLCALGASLIGDTGRALRFARAGMELALRTGNAFIERMACANLGAAYVFADQMEEGARLLEGLRERQAAAQSGLLDGFILPPLAECYRRNGEFARAAATAAEAVEVARAGSLLTAECLAQLTLAAALAMHPDPAAHDAAEAALRRTEAIIEESGAEAYRPRWHEARAVLCAARGDDAGSRRERRAAEASARAMGMDELADQMARELAQAGGERE